METAACELPGIGNLTFAVSGLPYRLAFAARGLVIALGELPANFIQNIRRSQKYGRADDNLLHEWIH